MAHTERSCALTCAARDRVIRRHLRVSSIGLNLSEVVLPGMSGPDPSSMVKEMFTGTAVLPPSTFPGEELIAQGQLAPENVTLEHSLTDAELAARVRLAIADEPSS